MLYYKQSLALLVFSACVCAFCLRAILECAGPAHSRASCGTAGNKQINKKLITRFLGFLPRAATHIIKTARLLEKTMNDTSPPESDLALQIIFTCNHFSFSEYMWG